MKLKDLAEMQNNPDLNQHELWWTTRDKAEVKLCHGTYVGFVQEDYDSCCCDACCTKEPDEPEDPDQRSINTVIREQVGDEMQYHLYWSDELFKTPEEALDNRKSRIEDDSRELVDRIAWLNARVETNGKALELIEQIRQNLPK